MPLKQQLFLFEPPYPVRDPLQADDAVPLLHAAADQRRVRAGYCLPVIRLPCHLTGQVAPTSGEYN